MRSLSNLCLFIILFFGGLSVNAAIAECHKATTSDTATPRTLKILSFDHQLKHNGSTPIPEIVITASHQSFITAAKTDTRDGAGTAREHFLARITTLTCKVQSVRLLSDLQAIVRLLIFPKHFFW